MHTHTHMCKSALSPGCSYWSISCCITLWILAESGAETLEYWFTSSGVYRL